MYSRSILAGLIISISATLAQASAQISAATLNWPPFYAEALEKNGFYSAIVRETFDRAGYEVDLEFVPWQRALNGTKQGNYDVLWGAYYNNERAKALAYSNVIMQNNEVFIGRDDSNLPTDVAQLSSYSIGVIAGSAQIRDLEDAGFSRFSKVKDGKQNLQKLAAGRVDLVLMSSAQFNFLASNDPEVREFRDQLTVVGEPFRSYDIFMAVSRTRSDSGEIVDAFNAALATVRDDGTFDQILEEFGQN